MPDARSLPEPAPQGIKSTYAPRGDAPGLSTAHIAPLVHVLGQIQRKRSDRLRGSPDGPGVTYALGGSYAEVGFGRGSACGVMGGGRRGDVTEFSRASRRRLMKLLNSVNRDATALPYFVTLTYHDTWPADRKGRKRHLDAFRKRLERRFGRFPAVWRLEFQRRGAPHYHLLLFLRPEQIAPRGMSVEPEYRAVCIQRLRAAVAWFWWEVVDREDDQLLMAGTSVERTRSWRGVNSYAAKYMGKLESFQQDAGPIGRCWGVWRREMLGISYVTHSLTFVSAFRVRRVLRKFARFKHRNRRRGGPQRFACFVGARTVDRLLSAYGYYRE